MLKSTIVLKFTKSGERSLTPNINFISFIRPSHPSPGGEGKTDYEMILIFIWGGATPPGINATSNLYG